MTDDAIESIKQSLAAKWGLHFPVRDPVASPSKRDRDAIEEKIHFYITFLHYRKPPTEGAVALRSAIAKFEQEASAIISEWRSNPRAETAVVTSRPMAESSLGRDFLHRRDELGPDVSRQLMLLLEHFLCEVVHKFKNGQSHQIQEPIKTGPVVKRLSSGKLFCDVYRRKY